MANRAMSQFSHLLLVGLKASGYISAAFMILWYALSFLDIILEFWLSLKIPLFGKFLWIYSALLYPLIALSIPIGQIYSFLIYRRRETQK
jgi:hypothetical protein